MSVNRPDSRASRRLLVVLTVGALAVAMVLPATTAAGPINKRAGLTNVTVSGTDCATGAIRGGSHEGSVTFTQVPPAGWVYMQIVVRHAVPNTTYLLGLGTPANCLNISSFSITTDALGNFSGARSADFVNTGTTYWLELWTSTDQIATAAVTF
jgi:hypothetical protein